MSGSCRDFLGSGAALAAGVAVALVSGCAARGGGGPAVGSEEGRWNDDRLLAWVSTIGGEESRFDGLASVERFERLQAAIEEVKQMVLHDARTEQEALEGLRMIVKHLSISAQDSIFPDDRNPLFEKRDPRYRDIGAYNPDAEYDQATIDGRFDYKLSGQLGTVPYVSITVNGSAEGKLGRAVAYLDDASIRKLADADGRFTVWLTKRDPGQGGGWIALPDEANGVVIRQYVADRRRDTLARFSIEAVGDPRPDVERVTDAAMAVRLGKLADYLVVSSTWHRTLLPQTRERPNAFVASTGAAIGASAANLENAYQMAYFEVGPDEALIVDFAPPRTVYWNLTSASIWHESQRYLTDPVSLTSSEVEARPDGRVRFVVAREDPGHPNWIKTFGHERGFLLLRMVGVGSNPLPVVERVPVAELAARLAEDRS